MGMVMGCKTKTLIEKNCNQSRDLGLETDLRQLEHDADDEDGAAPNGNPLGTACDGWFPNL